MEKKEVNPFGKLAKFNHRNFKLIGVLSLISVILFVPLAAQTFENTSSATTSFLSGGLESVKVKDLLNEEFPDRSESSLLIVLQRKDDSSVLANDSIQDMLKISEVLYNDSELSSVVEIASIASIENETQSLYNEGLKTAEELIRENLVEPFTSIADNISLIKSMYSNISELSRSLEQFAIFTDLYAYIFYDLARSTFYLSNLTTAYDTYFNFTDYSILEPFWDTTTGPLNKIIVLQAYLGTFANISQIRLSNTFADAFINGLTFSTLNNSMYSFYRSNPQLNSTPYVLSPLYQILLNLNQTWQQSFTNFLSTDPIGSVYGTLLGTDNITNTLNPLINGSQLLVLSKLSKIAQNAFPSLFNQTITQLAQAGGNTTSLDFGTIDPQQMLSFSVNDSLIEQLHLFPLGYLKLWADISRNIFYLANFTDAYVSGTTQFNPLWAQTLGSIWANESFGLWPYDVNVTVATYMATNVTVPPLGLMLGNLTFNQAFTDPSGADTTINSMTFNFLNQSIFGQYILNHPTNPSGYFLSDEYLNLLLLNKTWNDFFTLTTFGDALFDDYKLDPNIGPPLLGYQNPLVPQLNIPTIQASQLGIVNRLTGVANKTFVGYLSSTMAQFLTSDSSSFNATTNSTKPSYGLTINNQSVLENYTNLFSLSLFQQFSNGTSFNISTIEPLLSSQVVPIAVTYRYNTSIPKDVLKSSVLFLLNESITTLIGNESITNLFTNETSFNSPLFEPYVDEITNAINLSLIMSDLYDTTEPNATITVEDVVNKTTLTIMTKIREIVPVPTLQNNFGQDSEVIRPILEGFISSDNKTALLYVTFPGIQDEEELFQYVVLIREKLKNSGLNLESKYNIWVTGGAAIGYDTDISMEEDISTVDRVTVILVLILLTMVFLSVISPFVPLAAIGMAIVGALGSIYVVSQALNMGIPSIMISVLTVTMMGAGIDYCLFVMWRYKEERQRGRNRYSAVKEAVIHAGESVASSGSTVMIGFGSLMISSFSLLNQMGLGPMIGIGFSLLAALTLIPIGLYLFGDRLFWPRKFRKDYEKKLKEVEIEKTKTISLGINNRKKKEPFLRKTAKFTIKHPWLIIVLFAIFSLPFLYSMTQIQPSYDSVDFLPQDVEAVDGLDHLQGQFSLGKIFPIQVVLKFNSPISDSANSSFYNTSKLDLIEKFSQDLLTKFASIHGTTWIKQVETITRPYGQPINYSRTTDLDPLTLAQMKQYIGSQTNTTIIINVEVGEDIEPIGADALRLVGEIRQWRETYTGFSNANEKVEILVGGSVAQFFEIQEIINRETPLLIFVVMAGIFVVLFFITGSIFTPIRLELTILLSIVISLGAVQMFFHDFLGQGIPWMIPIMLFVLIFGLGMDYDIFIVTRMREEVAVRGATDEEAIVTALEKTGTIITAAGVIMASALGSLFLASSNILKIMGFAFFIAIILDATLVRQMLVPAMMVLAKKANWWNPIKRFQRVPDAEERRRLREQHAERIETDLIYNDLTDDELLYFEKDFKKDKKVIKIQRERVIELMQKYWKVKDSMIEQQRTLSQLNQIKTVITNIENKYDSYRNEIKEALDIWIEDNGKAITEVKGLINQLSEALGYPS